MSIRATITAQFEQIAVEQKRKVKPLSDDLNLLDSGLDSLSFALIVARPEDELEHPFPSAEDMKFPVTFGDFVSCTRITRNSRTRQCGGFGKCPRQVPIISTSRGPQLEQAEFAKTVKFTVSAATGGTPMSAVRRYRSNRASMTGRSVR